MYRRSKDDARVALCMGFSSFKTRGLGDNLARGLQSTEITKFNLKLAKILLIINKCTAELGI